MTYETEDADDTLGCLEMWGENESIFADIDDLCSGMDSKMTEKCDLLDLSTDLNLNDEEFEDIFNWNMEALERKEIVHHDCMWSGTCTDRFHFCSSAEPFEPDQFDLTFLPTCLPIYPQEELPAIAPTPPATPALINSVLPGRSLLITQQPQQQPQQPQQPQHRQQLQQPPIAIVSPSKMTVSAAASPPSPRRPDTPQSLDEEEAPQFKHHIDIAACASVRSVKIMPKYEYADDDDEEDEEPDDEDDDEDDEEYDDEDYRRDVVYGRVGDSRPARESTVASDHSYTLSKNSKPARVDLPGVCTPSDSEEEIDVVSLGEKMVGVGRPPVAMPMNPSPLARRQLQRTMASAVAERAGLSARPPPPQPRKRNRERSASPLMRHRKRTKALAKSSPIKTIPPKRRPYSSPNSDSEAENIERRSLHNDMERQRRIGLKNLFDELKMEVPSICEKERAPKVVVLREATALCKYFAKCDMEMAALKARQQTLLNRVKSLRKEFASKRPNKA